MVTRRFCWSYRISTRRWSVTWASCRPAAAQLCMFFPLPLPQHTHTPSRWTQKNSYSLSQNTKDMPYVSIWCMWCWCIWLQVPCLQLYKSHVWRRPRHQVMSVRPHHPADQVCHVLSVSIYSFISYCYIHQYCTVAETWCIASEPTHVIWPIFQLCAVVYIHI